MSSTEIVPSTPYAFEPEAGMLYDRTTGEALALAEADERTLAELDEQLRAQRDFFRTATAAIEEEIKARMNAQRTKFLDTGAHRLELERKREWDLTLTWEALQGLVAAGLISEADADAACPERSVRKPDGRKLNAILEQVVGEDPVAAQPLARARSERAYIKLVRTAVDGEVVE